MCGKLKSKETEADRRYIPLVIQGQLGTHIACDRDAFPLQNRVPNTSDLDISVLLRNPGFRR